MIRNKRGQALVETVLVIPLIFLTLFVFLRTIFFCSSVIKLERRVAHMARHEALKTDRSHIFFLPLGHWSTVSYSRNSRPVQPWRPPLRGRSVVREQGHLIIEEGALTFLPRLFGGHWIPKAQWHVTAESLREPDIPGES